MRPLAKLVSLALPALAAVGFLLATSSSSAAQDGSLEPATEDRLKILSDPEKAKEKTEKDKLKPPIEFFRSQVAPFDILPYVKANHWSTLSLECRSNYEDYLGYLQTSPARLVGMPREGMAAFDSPQEVVYRRDARLLKEQRTRIGLQMMLPRVPKELSLDLHREDSIRADEVWQASLRLLEPSQMLILVLTKGSNDAYARWNQFQAMLPMSADRFDPTTLDRQRYYRLVLPLDPEKPPLSSHPLTWTTMSHVIWDGMAPESLQPAQQQAMLDWIHWGGQLILVGGAAPSFAALRDSFLGPYLPAELSGENVLLKEEDLAPLSNTYRPPVPPMDRDEPRPIPGPDDDVGILAQKLYLPTEPIRPASNRPVFLSGLRPRKGATTIPLGEGSPRMIGIEARVGRGRILMLTINPTDPALASWPGIDTLVRRVLLRRPEDALLFEGGWNGVEMRPPSFAALAGPDLSWFRLLSRDIGALQPRIDPDAASQGDATTKPVEVNPTQANRRPQAVYSSSASVAEWVDSSALPRMSRDILEEASGISIPSSTFILKVIIAYVVALVPLNWLICRFVLGRREWAWVLVPVLSLAFAVGVERAAAYDVGYEVACDEIDVLELQGGYARAHLSRFASLYSTGRGEYSISFPDDPTALALPQDNGRSLRGEDIVTSTWQSQPVPALQGFQVQPRSLSLFRAEQLVDLPGTIALAGGGEGGARQIVNTSGLELHDAVLIEVGDAEALKETYLGTIAAGAKVEVKASSEPAAKSVPRGELNIGPFLREFRTYVEDRPENHGEVRLVAWSSKTLGGPKFEPAVDRHRGLTAVVAHLQFGAAPGPSGERFDSLIRPESQRPDRSNVGPEEVPDLGGTQGRSLQGGRPLTKGMAPARSSPGAAVKKTSPPPPRNTPRQESARP